MIPSRLIPRMLGVVILLTACAVGALQRNGELKTEAKPDDPVGAWKLSCVSPDGKGRECLVTVVREGPGFNGLYTADGATRPAKSVRFEEGFLILEVDGQFAGQVYGLAYKGVPQGDNLRGTVRWSYGWASGFFGFEGERVEQEVASAR